MFELSIKDHIASAHFIPGYDGPCRELHGHTWKVEVFIKSEQLDQLGLVIDFVEIKKKLKGFLEHIDHVCLNDLDYFKKNNPTTENIAKYIYQNFSKDIAPQRIDKVQVWESDSASVAYYE